MKWIDKNDELPLRGERVIFGYVIGTGYTNCWKEYKIDIYDEVLGLYVMNSKNYIICLYKDWKYWARIEEF